MKALFLDRDGVLNVLRPNDYVKTPDELAQALKYISRVPNVTAQAEVEYAAEEVSE